MEKNHWSRYFPGAIIVTDESGIITDLNDMAAAGYLKEGGAKLIGKSALDCHKGPSFDKVKELYKNQTLNAYTITKNGKKKLIYQAPYFVDGKFSGIAELSLPLPENMPHFNRDQQS